MGNIKIGCQTYPWKMNPKRFAGDVPHMVRTAADAGFSGLEAEIGMLGAYFENPERVREILEAYGMQLAALVLHQPWEGEGENREEAERTGKAISFLKYFRTTQEQKAGVKEKNCKKEGKTCFPV